MKNFFDEDLKRQIKPGLIIATFTVLLIYVLMNMGNIYLVLMRIADALKYLFCGIIIAYVFNQPMKLIEKQFEKYCQKNGFLYRRKRGLSIILTLILLLLLIGLIASIVIPNLIHSFNSLINNISTFIISVFNNLDEIFVYLNLDFRMDDVVNIKELTNMPWQDIATHTFDILGKSANGIMSNATGFLSNFGVAFTGFIFSLYLLGSKEIFLCQFRKIIAAIFGYKITCVIFNYAHKTNLVFSNFISGQLVEAGILWVLYYITMRLFGFPYPELIATIISIFSLVPFFGPICSMFIGAVLILSKDVFQAIWFMVYFQFLSQLEDNFIYPRVVGNSVGLPGIWVLLSILVFGDLFGVFGMIIAVPSAACLYALIGSLVNKALAKRRLEVNEITIKKI